MGRSRAKRVLFLNGELPDQEALRPYLKDIDCLYVADGAYRHALAMGLSVDGWFGDQDSLPLRLQSCLRASSMDKTLFEVDKDWTDGDLAYQALRRGGPDADYVICAPNSLTRPDHALGNLLMILKDLRESEVIYLMDGLVQARLFRGPIQLHLHYLNELPPSGSLELDEAIWSEDARISVIPLTELKGCRWTGARYPLNGEDLPAFACRAITNIPAEKEVSFEVLSGSGLLIQANEPRLL